MTTNMGAGDTNVDAVCDLIDKLTLRQLRLMEEKMRCELNIESSVNNGSIHLAKSRYIMGQSSVSATCLPVETSPEFSASTVCETSEEDGVTQLKISDNDADNIINPMKWFGVLLPQNMYKAQTIFQNAINYIAECANIQLQILDVMDKVQMLKRYKKTQVG